MCSSNCISIKPFINDLINLEMGAEGVSLEVLRTEQRCRICVQLKVKIRKITILIKKRGKHSALILNNELYAALWFTCGSWNEITCSPAFICFGKLNQIVSDCNGIEITFIDSNESNIRKIHS